jgi:hypothetical protein
MAILDWTSIWLILCCTFLIFYTAKLYTLKKALADLFICLGVIVLLSTNILYLVDSELVLYIRWGNILTTTFLVSSIFSLIRESKPVFARFPLYLVFLPFITLIFYPLIMNTHVISNIVLSTFQAGAICTSLLIYALKQSMGEKYGFRIVSILVLLIAFIIYWMPISFDFSTHVTTELLIGFASLIFSYDIYRNNFKRIDDEN